MQRIKSFGVMQTATTMAGVYFVLGIIAGVVEFFVFLFHGYPGSAVIRLIFLPIAYAVAGFVIVAIACAIYNEVARRLGGIEIELSSQ